MKDKFCLTSVSSFQEIRHNPINNSKAKFLWSFPKDDRFHETRPYCDNIYDLGGLRPNKNGVSLGKGSKYDFTKDPTASPGASRYLQRSFFDENVAKHRGFSMGVGRQQAAQRGHIELEPLKVPGPGSYESQMARSTSYSFRKKTKPTNRVNTISSQNDNPGPGAYENPEALNSSGNYLVSKHAGSGATKFNPKHSKRFMERKSNEPGPGSYHIPTSISSTARYINSKHEGSGQRAFSHRQRTTLFDEQPKHQQIIPGPGSYRLPSEFGQYDGNVYGRMMDKLAKRIKTEQPQ